MSETTDIGWTDSTISPWFICTEQSPGCLNCYARNLTEQKFAFVSKDGDPLKSGVIRRAYFKAGFEDWATRRVWGNKATRVLSKGFWTEAVKWNRQAAASGKRRKVFPSLMDWLDDFPAGVIDQEGRKLTAAEVMARLLDLLRLTPNIDWLLLTKRIEIFRSRMLAARNASGMSPEFLYWMDDWYSGVAPSHVWIGASVEDQKRADERIPLLLETPAAVRFLSVEPLLEAIDLTSVGPNSRKANERRGTGCTGEFVCNPLEGTAMYYRESDGEPCTSDTASIDWVIVGGESGKDRRDCGVSAIESVARQCVAAGVPVFVKQSAGLLPGTQGNICDDIWKLKQFPLSH